MARIATERSPGLVRVRKQRFPVRLRFCALDGSIRVIVEADNEDDARYLCREMRWEFICLCDA
ncbi:MAG TPA: hypothetical protein VHK26_06070 [Methyloceanibacter sp.]|jgi:hypothetical protein|nr:hypothetical protein [Methyloceanibacter sp.]